MNVRDCDLARIGFGQTIAVTGMQLACAVAAAVNGGNFFVLSTVLVLLPLKTYEFEKAFALP